MKGSVTKKSDEEEDLVDFDNEKEEDEEKQKKRSQKWRKMREGLLMRKCSRTVPGKKKNPVDRSDVRNICRQT